MRIAQWPCSNQQAAEALTEAAPVKVLLFRRVLRLQTLLFRGADLDVLDKAVEEAFQVYQHWETTYAPFINNCMTHHDKLPVRVQAWYVILCGHWHYGALLLAETLENIEQEFGTQRYEPGFILMMQRYNALKICHVMRLSLRQSEQHGGEGGESIFHDSMMDGTLLNEPWMAVLMRSLVKAGYIVLNDVDFDAHLQERDGPSEYPWRLVGSCIDALRCLGKKSDLALLSAQVLSRTLERRMKQRRLTAEPTVVWTMVRE